MSIHIDGIIFSLQRHGGISVYFKELLSYLERSGVSSTVSIEIPSNQKPPLISNNLRVELLRSRLFERYRRARVLSACSIFHSSYYRLPAQKSQTSVVTVHDFTYERFIHGPALWAHRLQKYSAIRAAEAIICISESTRDDLLEFVGVRPGQKLFVIPNGVSDIFRPLPFIEKKSQNLLFVGDRRGYKNFRMLLEALSFIDEAHLKCVGGGALTDDEFIDIPSSTRKRVSHLGFVSDDGLNELYNSASALVYPSAYEGFGIPVIEAMRAGCPVVSINCKAVQEVGGLALTVAKSDTPYGLAEAIDSLNSTVMREKKIAAGFIHASKYSWSATHEKTINVYRELGASV